MLKMFSFTLLLVFSLCFWYLKSSCYFLLIFRWSNVSILILVLKYFKQWRIFKSQLLYKSNGLQQQFIILTIYYHFTPEVTMYYMNFEICLAFRFLRLSLSTCYVLSIVLAVLPSLISSIFPFTASLPSVYKPAVFPS